MANYQRLNTNTPLIDSLPTSSPIVSPSSPPAPSRRLDNLYFETGLLSSLPHTPPLSTEAAAHNGIIPGRLSVPQRIVATVDRITLNTPARRLIHAMLPSVPVAASNPYRGQVIGNGMQNDGVFSNLAAKPTVGNNEVDTDVPPSYDEAAADAAPLYWESAVFSQYGDDVFVDGLPVGNIINFVWNLMVSSAFQFVGFILTYLLHTLHAAKEGSRAGLGVTFMSYGYYMIPKGKLFGLTMKWAGGASLDANPKFEPIDPNVIDVDLSRVLEGSIDNYRSNLHEADTAPDEGQYFDENSAPLFAYCLVALGVFIFIKSLLDYQRAKQMEKVILQSPETV